MPIESTSNPERIYLVKKGEKFIATWKHFGNACTSLDPVIEAFRARRSHYEKLKDEETDEYIYDVHIVIEHRGKDTSTPEGWITRHYGFSYCQYSNNPIDQITLHSNFEKLLNVIFSELTQIFDKWFQDETGMASFLKTRNKEVLDAFLYKNKFKDHDPPKKKQKTKAEKRAARIAYAIAHPETTKEHRRKCSEPD